MSSILMGPVLSFRGAVRRGHVTWWQVTAAIAIGLDDDVPALWLDGQAVAAAPVELARTPDARMLRYDLGVPLAEVERRVRYRLGNDVPWEFTVPAAAPLAPRLAYVSCNGFSEPNAVKKLRHPLYNAWADLLANHDRRFRPAGYVLDKEQRWHEALSHDAGVQRFHLLAMGGDQLYLDAIWQDRDRLPELSDWVELPQAEQLAFEPDDDLRRRIGAYYDKLYFERWAPRDDAAWGLAGSTDRGSACAMASIPTIMMWDDHDIFDGWGSYPPAMQYCPLFRCMFDAARRAFWVYQLQQRAQDLPALRDDGWRPGAPAPDAPLLQPVDWGAVRVADPLTLPFLAGQPGFAQAFDLGKLALLVLDLRTERSKKQIMGEAAWQAMIGQLGALPAGGAEHLLLMSSIPVAHPRFGAAEYVAGALGANVLTSLDDDLNDQWSHRFHEGERKRLARTLIPAALDGGIRITLLSGDVHLAAWGTIYRKDATPAQNWMRINQLTSSAVVHPAPAGLLPSLMVAWLNRAAAQPQVIDTEHVIEMMTFPESADYMQPTRNWLALELDAQAFDRSAAGRRRLWATWRCEADDDFTNHLLAIHPVG